uniref:ATP synthase complex subunit 8 n=1 Tax=Anoplotermes group sp. N TB-2017 TaxID=1934629 RepID=A0A1S5VNF0_9NEOP|nr:ATP synthase F0 subunit 8 [Anoplotermes group sp. N TB-2017]AQP30117.1 ATP synthase F0 subunit 8 [Anoplotermes group sp. N TB-2017]
MPQMMPMEWTLLYATFLMTFLMFNIVNYFALSPSQEASASKKIYTNKTNWKW